MINNYEVAEISELGRAQDVILGGLKISPFFPESSEQPARDETQDDE